MGGMGPPATSAAVPVQVATAHRQRIAQHLETNGVLEAENEVDLVARLAGPVVELLAEEGMAVAKDQLLLRIDDREAANQVAIARVSANQAQLALDRATSSWDKELISREDYDRAVSDLESANAQLAIRELELSYAQVRAPFAGLIVTRYVKLAEQVSVGTQLYRLSDFTPLLCPIQVPEKDLASLALGQPAYLSVEAFADERFDAAVLRINPRVDAETGTIKVTLKVEGKGKLRPGMFASVFLVTASHDNALVIPKSALVLDSIGDTVFVKDGDAAARREVTLGFRESDLVEVLSGVAEGEEVIVLGQEGLSDGTPIEVLGEGTMPTMPTKRTGFGPPPQAAGGQGAPAPAGRPAAAGQREEKTPDQGEEQAPEQQPPPAQPGPGGQWGHRPPGAMEPPQGQQDGERPMPPQFVEMLKNATPEQLEFFKQRMRERGLSEEEIEQRLAKIRGDDK